MLKKFEEKKPLEKKITFEYVLKIFLGIVAGSLDCVLSVASDFLGNSDHDNEDLYKKIMIAFEDKIVLLNSTTSKKNSNIIAIQIAVISDSSDKVRKVNSYEI